MFESNWYGFRLHATKENHAKDLASRLRESLVLDGKIPHTAIVVNDTFVDLWIFTPATNTAPYDLLTEAMLILAKGRVAHPFHKALHETQDIRFSVIEAALPSNAKLTPLQSAFLAYHTEEETLTQLDNGDIVVNEFPYTFSCAKESSVVQVATIEASLYYLPVFYEYVLYLLWDILEQITGAEGDKKRKENLKNLIGENIFRDSPL